MLTRLGDFLRSSIGKKSLMSITGLMLIGFLIVHVAGNLTLFADGTGEAFDSYAHTLEANPLLPLAEVGLVALFVAHIALGLRTALANREARDTRYKELNPHGKRTWSSMTMILTGSLVLIFVIVHLLDFRLAERAPDGLAAMVVRRLSQPLGALIYVVGVLALGVHLRHAFQSLLQSLGVSHPRYHLLIQRAGVGLAVLLGVLFAAFPVLCLARPQSFGQGVGESSSIEAPSAGHQDSPSSGPAGQESKR